MRTVLAGGGGDGGGDGGGEAVPQGRNAGTFALEVQSTAKVGPRNAECGMVEGGEGCRCGRMLFVHLLALDAVRLMMTSHARRGLLARARWSGGWADGDGDQRSG